MQNLKLGGRKKKKCSPLTFKVNKSCDLREIFKAMHLYKQNDVDALCLENDITRRVGLTSACAELTRIKQ